MLTENQKTKLAKIQAGLGDVVMAYNDLKNLIDKVERVGNDEELTLTETQIDSLISKYIALRTNIVDKINALPTI